MALHRRDKVTCVWSEEIEGSVIDSDPEISPRCHRNIEVLWLLRSLKPDFKTIADFRRDNRAAFRSVFGGLACLAHFLAMGANLVP